jgi:hypothetical protein
MRKEATDQLQKTFDKIVTQIIQRTQNSIRKKVENWTKGTKKVPSIIPAPWEAKAEGSRSSWATQLESISKNWGLVE